jgi:putative transposase
MSYVKIVVHVVWGTKYREPVLVLPKRQIVFNHIVENATTKNIRLITIGGFLDHVHCLISLSHDQTLSKTVQLLKGESSNWANKREVFPEKLIWAEDYFAASVSESAIKKVIQYIENQEEHHMQTDFETELSKFKLYHGFE